MCLSLLAAFLVVFSSVESIRDSFLLTSRCDAQEKSYVDFDLTPLPCSENRKWQLALKVSTEKTVFVDKTSVTGVTDRFTTCETFVLELREKGFEAEVIDKSKIRVYGAKSGGKFYPAIKGEVESPDLKKEELPTVMVIGKKG